jgi:hypothetical protein
MTNGMAYMNAKTRSRRRFRSRTFLTAVGAAVVVAVGGVAVAAGDGTPKSPPTVAGTATISPTAAAPTPAGTTAAARVVAADERVDLGHGNITWLTSNGYHWISSAASSGAQYGKSVTDDRFFPDDTVDLRVYAAGAATLYTGAYHGEREAAKITVQVAGQTLNAKLLTLPGDPGWSAYYVDGPAAKLPEHKGDSVKALVTVHAADGTVLATTPGTEPLAK